MPNSGIQTCTPTYLSREIEAARSIDQLRALGAKMLDMVRFAIGTDADIKSLVQLISQLNDAMTLRLIALLESSEGIRLPEGAAYLALGSEGRGEQTLRTDQDSAIVYFDDLSPEKLREVERFATRLVNALEEIGVPRCPGKIMASNPQWRHSLTEWKRLLDQWITEPTPEHMLNFGMFQDMRVLHGDQRFESELRTHIYETARSKSLFFPSMARNIVRFKPPIGMFGRLLVEKSGPCRGKLDLKKGGMFAMVRGIGLLALEVGIVGGSTWEKVERLRSLNLISSTDLEAIEESFNTLVRMRLGRQLSARAANQEADNCIDPLVMTERQRIQLRAALRGVDTLLQILRSHYKLDMIAR